MTETKARKKSRFGADEDPIVVTDATDVSISPGASDSARISFKVIDPEGFPLTYSGGFKRDSDNVLFTGQSGGLPPPLASPVVITVGGDGTAEYKFVSRTAESDGSGYTTTDAYKYRFIASDGINTVSSTKAFSLSFKTDFTFDTSLSTISSTYTDTNKVRASVSASTGTARSQQNAKTGKGYLEYKVVSSASYMMLGLGWSNYNGGYTSSTSTYVYSSGGTRYPGGYSLPGMGSFGANDIIMIAYDTAPAGEPTIPKIWWGKNGSWATMTPGSHAGYPFTIPSDETPTNWDTTNQYLRPVFHYGGGSAASYDIEIISHTQGAQYTIPTGWSLA